MDVQHERRHAHTKAPAHSIHHCSKVNMKYISSRSFSQSFLFLFFFYYCCTSVFMNSIKKHWVWLYFNTTWKKKTLKLVFRANWHEISSRPNENWSECSLFARVSFSFFFQISSTIFASLCIAIFTCFAFILPIAVSILICFSLFWFFIRFGGARSRCDLNAIIRMCVCVAFWLVSFLRFFVVRFKNHCRGVQTLNASHRTTEYIPLDLQIICSSKALGTFIVVKHICNWFFVWFLNAELRTQSTKLLSFHLNQHSLYKGTFKSRRAPRSYLLDGIEVLTFYSMLCKYIQFCLYKQREKNCSNTKRAAQTIKSDRLRVSIVLNWISHWHTKQSVCSLWRWRRRRPRIRHEHAVGYLRLYVLFLCFILFTCELLILLKQRTQRSWHSHVLRDVYIYIHTWI